ncbi:uncharacterized protein PFLUO_LOCUS6334 [Penicillium psychrofluorescens]|uniref:uncharacterized protein n=1 Tax=Penicillium psychrofluorescens TaxID=3158075 RepID=UPI003CCCC418
MGKDKKQKEKRQIPLDQLPLEKRLHATVYNADDCNAAIHGERVPVALGLEVSRLCVIHGIRHHHGFAQDLRGVIPEFTRALNARDIMSGIIPEMNNPEDVPYCIWHPDVPSQETLRALIQRYPHLVYHAAWACAIAGYIDVYKELDVLPEVHVAEEASYACAERKNEGSEAIYQLIVSQHVKFAVFNDYNRTVDISNPRVASCNGNTAVYSSLAARQAHKKPRVKPHDTSHYFNTTEDWGIDDHDCDAPPPPGDYLPLLYGPLPVDLPPVDKSRLIQVAAYTGDIDRYTRLRRPQMIEDEFLCVIRGIYHNVFWAKWWSSQIPETFGNEFGNGRNKRIRCAINARRIMSDDVTWVTDSTPDGLLPCNIWWPAVASPETYERLARKRPVMLERCLRACIAADYQEMWDKLLVSSSSELATSENIATESTTGNETQDLKLQRLSQMATTALLMEAEQSTNDHYLRDIQAAMPDKVEALGHCRIYDFTWESHISAKFLYSPGSDGYRLLDRNDPVRLGNNEGAYDGLWAKLQHVDFAVFVRDVIGLDHKIWKEKGERESGSEYITMGELYEALEADKTLA